MKPLPSRRLPLTVLASALAVSAVIQACRTEGREPQPISYLLQFPAPETQMAEIHVEFPTEGREDIELFMPVWSPGYYRVQDYAGKIEEISARNADGQALALEAVRSNRWRVRTEGADEIIVFYRLYCPDSFVTTNWVSADLLVLNGGASYITAVGETGRPYEVTLEPAPTWEAVATGLPAVEGGERHRYRADDFDTLVDAPIVAGDLEVTTFLVDGVEHQLVDVGERHGWDPERAARDLEEIVEESLPLWGELPYQKYVFLNTFRPAAGGLEHGNSTLLTASPDAMSTPERYRRWLSFVAHEYFHSFNVKRLRPVELGPFDYEAPPTTPSLWLSEGVTSYYGDLFVARAGLSTTNEYLASMSGAISRLQNSPGRLLQTLAQSSLEVWDNSNSGVGAAPTTVSYYVKGEVVGFLLDAHIRTVTDGERTFEDVMRLAYERYGGERGFTPEEFRATAEEVAGVDLQEWFRIALNSTEELDYSEALEWFGLRFAADSTWTLVVRPDATGAQQEHLRALLASADPEDRVP